MSVDSNRRSILSSRSAIALQLTVLKRKTSRKWLQTHTGQEFLHRRRTQVQVRRTGHDDDSNDSQ
ncbi:hypothetical protein CKA32_006550 [Geitlerinema sp. FC II]|nr:hypothetical protein CKA32_006550 [Geitlerinema sp. FC II]